MRRWFIFYQPKKKLAADDENKLSYLVQLPKIYLFMLAIGLLLVLIASSSSMLLDEILLLNHYIQVIINLSYIFLGDFNAAMLMTWKLHGEERKLKRRFEKG